MIVYFTTVVRMAPLESGGELIKLDWNSKRVIARVPIVPKDPEITDPNPRGGTRGGRGILLNSDEVYVASYHTIQVFDSGLRPVRSFSNFLFAGLHELGWDDGALWVSCTDLDAAIKVDRFGDKIESWWPRADPVVSDRYGLSPFGFDEARDNRLLHLDAAHTSPGHTHLNAINLLQGRPLVLLNRYGCLVHLKPTRILVEDEGLRGAHNVLVTSDEHLLVNDTVGQRLLVYDSAGKPLRDIRLGKFPPVRRIRWRFALRSARIALAKRTPSHRLRTLLSGSLVAARPVFVRGLCETATGTVLVGVSPASILEIDWSTGRLVDHFRYSDDVHNAVHGLACRA